MSQTIHRMYDSEQRAHAAAHELRTNRYLAMPDVHVFAAGGESSGEAIVAALMKAYILKAHARVLAQHIQRGGTLVTVHAPFGSGSTAVEILDSHGPIESGVPDFKGDGTPWDEAAPCSSLLGMPVLLKDSATFSRFWNVPPLSKRPTTTGSALGIPEISATSGPFSGTFGMGLISHKATILSSMLGLPVLKKARPAGR